MTRLSEIEAEKAKAKALLEQLEAEEQGLIEAQATESHGAILSTIAKFGAHYTLKQRKDIATALGLKATVATTKTDGSGSKRPAKFQVPDGKGPDGKGTTWVGTGRQPTAFLEWAETAPGKAWKKKNPDQEWPAYPFKA